MTDPILIKRAEIETWPLVKSPAKLRTLTAEDGVYLGWSPDSGLAMLKLETRFGHRFWIGFGMFSPESDGEVAKLHFQIGPRIELEPTP